MYAIRLLALSLSLCALFATRAQSQTYKPDILSGFEALTLHLPTTYDGEATATLVCHTNERREQITGSPDRFGSDKAILYIHGYNDYFFQSQLGDSCLQYGYAFYALDLRRYGRSYRQHQQRFYCRSLDEYHEEIDEAIRQINREGYGEIVLMGHSTGGLIASHYAFKHSDESGKVMLRDGVELLGLVLNSPFLDFNMSGMNENVLIPLFSLFADHFPNTVLQGFSSVNFYAQTLLSTYRGEWQYDTAWKLPYGNPITLAWIAAIHNAQQEIREQKHQLSHPTLLLHSSATTAETEEWNDAYMRSDIVLDVDDIARYGAKISRQMTTRRIENGLHDLILSPEPARSDTYLAIKTFLETL